VSNIRRQFAEGLLDLLVRNGQSDTNGNSSSTNTNLDRIVVCFRFVHTGDSAMVPSVSKTTRTSPRPGLLKKKAILEKTKMGLSEGVYSGLQVLIF